MARYAASIKSSRPAAETFDYLARFSNAAAWDPGVLDGEQLDPGPVREGTRFRLVVPFLGREQALTYRVTRLAPAQLIILEAASLLIRATDTIRVTPQGSGARVSYTAEVRLRGPLRLADPLLARAFRAIGDRAAAGLARALNGAPAERPGVGP
jgi:carbon monoxide dehydrogenase subunit G